MIFLKGHPSRVGREHRPRDFPAQLALKKRVSLRSPLAEVGRGSLTVPMSLAQDRLEATFSWPLDVPHSVIQAREGL